LAVLGIVAIGALLFDMLLLSRGLVVSFGHLLAREGFDIRVMATDATPLSGPLLEDAGRTAAAIAALPEVESVARIRIGQASSGSATDIDFIGADPDARPMWTVVAGRDLSQTAGADAPLLVNSRLAQREHLQVGASLLVSATCGEPDTVLPPRRFTVAGIADFPFDDAEALTMAGRLPDLVRLCGREDEDSADMLVVRSRASAGPDAAAAAIAAIRPDLHVVTNQQIIERFSRVEFSYFQQISFVLSTLTLFFGFLLIAVLLTVSVNQRLGEIAALRAIGLSRGRVMAGVLCESALMVGAGGVIAVPAGALLSMWLDRILRALPGIPTSVSFFVFEPRVLILYGALLAGAAAGAALYPMRIVGTLPIAPTLRREVLS
jgi:putative ABC transport system permease protein